MKTRALFLLILVLSTRSAAAEAPNFILIYADDLGYADTSVQMMDASMFAQAAKRV